MDRETLETICRKLESVYWKNASDIFNWNGEFTKSVIKHFYISLCTTCMDRLDDLKNTLPKNIEDNINYPNIEFLVLDYNSKRDNISDWIKSEMMNYIDSGILNYYRTEEPKFYTMGHSRNVAFKLAKGEIVNNIDADNYVNRGFVEYLNKLANEAPERAVFYKTNRLRGRVGFYKSDFIDLLGGYDESFVGYGFDDRDIQSRALALKFKSMWYSEEDYYFATSNKPSKSKNYGKEGKNIRYTMLVNKLISFSNLFSGIYKVNQGVKWGKATLVKNFSEEIQI